MVCDTENQDIMGKCIVELSDDLKHDVHALHMFQREQSSDIYRMSMALTLHVAKVIWLLLGKI